MIRDAGLVTQIIKQTLAWAMRTFVLSGKIVGSPEELKRYPSEMLVEIFGGLEQARIRLQSLDDELFTEEDGKRYDLGMNTILKLLEAIKNEAKTRSDLRVNELGGKEYIIKASLSISCRG
jgi:hypothetical protein